MAVTPWLIGRYVESGVPAWSNNSMQRTALRAAADAERYDFLEIFLDDQIFIRTMYICNI
jgi:hypothetical protein